MNSQKCGASLYTFNIYTLNGQAKKTFFYEFLPASKEQIEIAESTTGYQRDGVIPIILMDIKSLAYSDTLNEKFSSLFTSKNILRKGVLTPSFEILAFEMFYYPILLKISDGMNEYCILGNFFGGCKKDLSIIWKNGSGIQIGRTD